MCGARRIRRRGISQCVSLYLRSGTRSRTSGPTGDSCRGRWLRRCCGLLLLQLRRLLLVATFLVLYDSLELSCALDDIGQSILRRGLDGASTTTADIGRYFAVIGVKTGQGRESGRLKIELHAAAAATTAGAAVAATAASAYRQGFLDRWQRVIIPRSYLRVLIFGPAVDTVARKRRRRG